MGFNCFHIQSSSFQLWQRDRSKSRTLQQTHPEIKGDLFESLGVFSSQVRYGLSLVRTRNQLFPTPSVFQITMDGMLLNPSGCCWNSMPCNSPATLFLLSGEILPGSGLTTPCQVLNGGRVRMKYFAVHNAVKKSKKRGRSSKFETLPPNDVSSDVPPLADNSDNDEEVETSSSPEKSEVEKGTVLAASRGAVLQACTLTSCFIGGLGILIRQVSHFAYNEGFPILDCSSQISFRFELWHMELIAGLVLGVSSCRYILLNSWTDFAESSEAANYQVLSSLEPLDYLVVAFLPGISEEMLFRGALLPLFGINWMSVVAVATLFGVLHLGSGRKYSFTIWATLVGIAYGWATVASSSIIVPMASHALNNLIGGIIWRNTSTSTRQD